MNKFLCLAAALLLALAANANAVQALETTPSLRSVAGEPADVNAAVGDDANKIPVAKCCI
jgi:hypothetical protein